jgi:hypothetical protein
MKKVLLLIAAILLAACNRSNNTEQTEQAIKEIMSSYAKVYDDRDRDITAVYDEKEDCIDLKWKGEMMNVSYKLFFKDLLTDNPQSYADKFIIVIILPATEIKSVSDMELTISGVKCKITPCLNELLGEKIVTLGFSDLEESFCKYMDILGRITSPVSAVLNTNKGKIEIPFNDMVNLQAMAHSYILDGGTFTQP